MTALKVQIRFRKHILQQEHIDKSVFKFSDKQDGTYTVQRLSDNLIKLVSAAESETPERQLSLDSTTPHFLVSRRVSHSFMENEEIVQYTGTVISMVPGFPTWYNIVYDNEPDCVYTYQLLDDYNNGDLTLI